MDYTLRFQDTPRDQILTMMRWASERNDAKAKERKDDYMELMKKLGKGYAAYKMNAEYDDWLKSQQEYADEMAQIKDIESGYYDPNLIDIDAALERERIIQDQNDWRNKYSKSHRYGVDNLQGLRNIGLA